MINKYSIAALAAIAILAIASVGVIYKAVIAQDQDGKFSHIYAKQTGDENIVATVGDITITREDIRRAADYRTATNASVRREQAIGQVIVPRLDAAILYAEAKRLGHEASIEETQAFIAPIRTACEGPQGGECQELIREHGFTAEEYWRSVAPSYRRELSIMKLQDAHIKSLFPNGPTYEERVAAKDSLTESLRRSAVITWSDPDLSLVYEQALQDPSRNKPTR